MSTSKRAREKRRAKLKARRQAEMDELRQDAYAQLPEEQRMKAVLLSEERLPMNNLPAFIQKAAKEAAFHPVWNSCYSNAVKLGWILDDLAYDVQYCEAIVEQGDIEKRMGKDGKGHPHSHAWLRINGQDYNISSNGAPIKIYRKHKMVVMPIKKMRLASSWQQERTIAEDGNHKPWLGDNLSEFNGHRIDVKPYVFDYAIPEILTEHISTSDEVWEEYSEEEIKKKVRARNAFDADKLLKTHFKRNI